MNQWSFLAVFVACVAAGLTAGYHDAVKLMVVREQEHTLTTIFDCRDAVVKPKQGSRHERTR